jgi:cyanate permease
LSAIWMLAGFATAGPSIAGYMADMTGGFVPALSLFGLALMPVAVAALFMNAAPVNGISVSLPARPRVAEGPSVP